MWVLGGLRCGVLVLAVLKVWSGRSRVRSYLYVRLTMAHVHAVLSEELQTAMRLLGARRVEDLSTQHVSLTSIRSHGESH